MTESSIELTGAADGRYCTLVDNLTSSPGELRATAGYSPPRSRIGVTRVDVISEPLRVKNTLSLTVAKKGSRFALFTARAQDEG